MRSKLPLISPALAVLGFVTVARSEGYYSNRGYMNFSAGVALQQNITLRNNLGETARATFDPGVRFDFSAGIETPKGWAFELETALIYNAFDEIGGVALSSTGDNLQMLEVPLLINALYQPRLSESLTAYIGAGVGGVATTFFSGDGWYYEYDSDFTFGYQGMAGFRYEFGERWSVGLAYKFLGTTDHDLGFGVESGGTLTHSFLISVNHEF